MKAFLGFRFSHFCLGGGEYLNAAPGAPPDANLNTFHLWPVAAVAERFVVGKARKLPRFPRRLALGAPLVQNSPSAKRICRGCWRRAAQNESRLEQTLSPRSFRARQDHYAQASHLRTSRLARMWPTRHGVLTGIFSAHQWPLAPQGLATSALTSSIALRGANVPASSTCFSSGWSESSQQALSFQASPLSYLDFTSPARAFCSKLTNPQRITCPPAHPDFLEIPLSLGGTASHPDSLPDPSSRYHYATTE